MEADKIFSTLTVFALGTFLIYNYKETSGLLAGFAAAATTYVSGLRGSRSTA